MDILDDSRNKIGHLTWHEVLSPAGLFPNLPETQYSSDLIEIITDIGSKILFPAVQLDDIQIYELSNRKNGYGRKALNRFLKDVSHHGYNYSIVKIGKYNPEDSLEGNTQFYMRCGWVRFITPSEYSLRFAYFQIPKKFDNAS
jgi:hypothetical protein